MAEIARVQQQLLLRIVDANRPEGDAVTRAGELLDDRQQLKRAEGLADCRVGSCLLPRRRRPTLGAAEHDHCDAIRRGVGLEVAAELEAVHTGHVDVEHDDVGS
jgi:hypothetical protein